MVGAQGLHEGVGGIGRDLDRFIWHQMSITYVKQRGDIDCSIAAIAMACDLSYEQAAAGLVVTDGTGMRLAEAIQPEGGNDDLTKAWLRCNGWAWQEVTRNLWRGSAFHPVHPWPPAPFANTHICFVEATAGWHYCVMDFVGRVFDPWNEARTTLSHPDYKRVATVLGLFKMGARRDRVPTPRASSPSQSPHG